MNQRPFVQVYEEATDDSGFEHVNPNIVMATRIEDYEDEIVVVITNTDNNERMFQFPDVKSAQRFIRRLAGE